MSGERLNNVSQRIRERGEALATFLEKRRLFVTEADYATYLELRGIQRYRVIAYPFDLIVLHLPADRLSVMQEVGEYRPAWQQWAIRPLRWWQRGRRIVLDEACRLVP